MDNLLRQGRWSALILYVEQTFSGHNSNSDILSQSTCRIDESKQLFNVCYRMHPKDDGRLCFQFVHHCGGVGGYLHPARWGEGTPNLPIAGVPIGRLDEGWNWMGYPLPRQEIEPQSEHMLCGERYTSCIHAGGLSCIFLGFYSLI